MTGPQQGPAKGTDRGQKRHHYVSKSYLDLFGAHIRGGISRIWAQRREMGPSAFRTNTTNAASICGYYTLVDPAEPDALRIENAFAAIEAAGLAAIRAMETGLNPTEQHRRDLGIYLGCQFTRTPRFESRLKELQSERWRSWFARSPERDMNWLTTQFRVPEDVARFLSNEFQHGRAETIEYVNNEPVLRDGTVKLMLSRGVELGQRLAQMRWVIVPCPPELSLVTNDNPMVIASVHGQEMKFFPLSPRALLSIDVNPGPVTAMRQQDVNTEWMRQIIAALVDASHEWVFADTDRHLEWAVNRCHTTIWKRAGI